MRKGRPRDERIEEKITGAALAVLAESGFTAFSVGEVAERAGVAKTTVYRRFPAREDLIGAAVERLNDDLPKGPTAGPVRVQLATLLQGIRSHTPDSEWSRILAHAVGQGARDSTFAEMVRSRVLMPRRQLLRDVIEAGIASGELRSDLDPDVALPVLVGPMLYLGKWDNATSSPRVSVEQVLDVIMAGMTPATSS